MNYIFFKKIINIIFVFFIKKLNLYLKFKFIKKLFLKFENFINVWQKKIYYIKKFLN